ncbi:MAG: hypothetical protein ACXWLQ_09240, partial [Rhizomicrobium sp.]
MLRFVLNEAGQLLLSLFGAALMSSAIATLSVPHASDGVLQFLLAWGLRLNGSAHLQFGLSSITGVPIARELAARLPLTLGLVLEGMAAAALIGIPIGFLFGAGPVRRAAAPLIQIVAAAPVFCVGLGLAYLSANPPSWPAPIGDGVRFGLKILPQTAAHAPATLLPALTVGLAGAAAVQLALRRAAAETARESWRIYLQ